MALERGTRLGPYDIESVPGAGGMGEVYRARDTRLKRDVAIKILPGAFARDPDRIARLQREAEVLATLNHPNIAAVYGFEESRAATGIVLDQFEAVPLQGSESASGCFFSADGQSIGVLNNQGLMRTISLSDRLVTVTDDVNFLYGATWGNDDRIVFVRNGSLWQISRSGGNATQLTTLGGEMGDTLHSQPRFMPGGKVLLFAASSGERRRIDALVLATGERRTVLEGGTMPMYATSGHLVFVRNGELLAAPFDADRLAVTGSTTQAMDKVPTQLQGLPSIDISESGTVVYAPTTAVSRRD